MSKKAPPLPTGVLGVVVIVAGLAAVFLWLSMLAGPWNLVSGLRDAGNHFDAAEKALSKSALKDARYETAAGESAVARARDGFTSDGPVYDLLDLFPVARDALGEVDHIIRAAELSSNAAKGTLEVAQGALKGPDKIITKEEGPDGEEGDSFIDLDRIEEIGKTISDVRNSIRGVGEELSKVDLKKLPRRLRPTITDGIERAEETDELLGDAEAGFDILPSFLGKDGPRNYLIGMQNPAELRGTGGAMLRFVILTIDGGRPQIQQESDVYDVDKNRTPYDIDLPPDAWYQQAIEDSRRFGNANWSPDWPFAAELTVRYAQAADAANPGFGLPRIDGVLLVDPLTMESLMAGVGKFYSDKYKVYVTKETVVEYLLYRAYAAKPVPRVRKARLKDIVDTFYDKMLKPTRPSDLVRGFGEALAEKHMQIWLVNPTEQAFVKRMNWDAALQDAKKSDYLNVVQQNVGGNKLDYHASQETVMRVTPEGDDVRVATEVRITNNVFLPQPRWALGNSGPNHRPMVNVYVPGSAELFTADVDPPDARIDAAADGAASWATQRPATHMELGKKVWSVVLGDPAAFPPGMPPGTSAAVRYQYRVPDVINTVEDRTVYRLVLQHQPKAHPETVEIRFALPDGARSITAKGWKKAEGNVLVWDRVLDEDLVLEVSWQS
jgi:hypothetical protein